MAKKNKPDNKGFVFSTDPNFIFEEDNVARETAAPQRQPLRIRLDTRHRAGKAVTLVTGFSGTTADLETLGRQLKSICGSGGSVKDGEIIVQGDHRDKLHQWLIKNGYAQTKKQ
jgi:translation initiation factor 1